MAKFADKGARLGNLIIDLSIIILLYILFIVVMIFLFSDIMNDYVLELELIIIVIFFLYYVILESVYGKTIGKMCTKTSVIDKNFKKPSVWKVILRTLFRFFLFCPLAYLFSFYCFHDIWSGTKVVKN